MFEDDVEDYYVDKDSEIPSASVQQPPEPQEPAPSSHVIDFGDPKPKQQALQELMPANGGSRRFVSWIAKVAVVAVLVVGAWGYFRYFSPVVDRAVMDVHVENVQRRGVLFKTFEADLIYGNEVVKVSVVDETVFLKLQSFQSSEQKIRVGYCKYAATLPWRGESPIVVTDIAGQ